MAATVPTIVQYFSLLCLIYIAGDGLTVNLTDAEKLPRTIHYYCLTAEMPTCSSVTDCNPFDVLSTCNVQLKHDS